MDVIEKMKVIEKFIERLMDKGLDNLSNEEIKELLEMEKELEALQNQLRGNEVNNATSGVVDSSYRKEFFVNLEYDEDEIIQVLEMNEVCIKVEKEIEALKILKSSGSLEEDEILNYYLLSLLHVIERESGYAHYFVKYKNKIRKEFGIKAKDFDMVYQSLSKLLTDYYKSLKGNDIETINNEKNRMKKYLIDSKLNYWLVAEELLKQEYFMREGNENYIYDNGVYVGYNMSITKKIKDKLGVLYSDIKNIREVLNQLDIELTQYDNTEKHTNYQYKNQLATTINFANGLYDLKTNQLNPHTPTFLSKNQIPYNFTEKYDEQSMEILMNILKTVVEEESIPVLLEYIGMCMTVGILHQQFIILYGDGGNGKSTLLSLITNLLGAANVSNVSLEHLSKDKNFTLGLLDGKLANIGGELAKNGVVDMTNLKLLTGEDKVRMEKKFKDSEFKSSYAKMIFSCNFIPPFNENGAAIKRRLRIVNCPYKVSERAVYNSEEIAMYVADKEIINCLIYKSVAAYSNVINNTKQLMITPTMEKLIDEYLDSLKIVKKFIEENVTLLDYEMSNGKHELKKPFTYKNAHNEVEVLKVLESDYMTMDELFELYYEWCKNNNYRAKNKGNFEADLLIDIEGFEARIVKKSIKKNGVSKRVRQCFGVLDGDVEDFIENKISHIPKVNGNVVNLKDLMG
ncbi:DNA primase family protein [Sporosarcina sp. FSL K6-3457]|uniref:DNA primase family protein n=1 Tax=Sporosarcina sp. FSL K6-3457 TaxID=2978204 RepID=UPI0030FC0B30